jgi:hypothetical protein
MICRSSRSSPAAADAFAALGPGLVQNEVAKKFPVDAIWRNKDYDKSVTLTGMAGEKDGEIFYQLADGPGIRGSELDFDAA